MEKLILLFFAYKLHFNYMWNKVYEMEQGRKVNDEWKYNIYVSSYCFKGIPNKCSV
jgi:hypothetical protein